MERFHSTPLVYIRFVLDDMNIAVACLAERCVFCALKFEPYGERWQKCHAGSLEPTPNDNRKSIHSLELSLERRTKKDFVGSFTPIPTS
jgi:hypothetical protein